MRDAEQSLFRRSYSCNAIHKGRALQYAVEVRRAENKSDKDIYVYHLDHESLITKQTLCSILCYLEGTPKPISEGLIIYPVQAKEEIKVSNLMDTLRPFCCFECLSMMSGGKPAYIHGSNLLVRSDIEDQVGWTNGKTLAEDTLFAINARSKFGPDVFGWHGGVVEEKSPLNLKDLVKQRRRWFYGLIMNLKFFERGEKIRQCFRALIWTSAVFGDCINLYIFHIPKHPMVLESFLHSNQSDVAVKLSSRSVPEWEISPVEKKNKLPLLDPNIFGSYWHN